MEYGGKMIRLPDLENYIAETVIRNVKLRCKNGEQISKILNDQWELYKKENANSIDTDHSNIKCWFTAILMPEIFLQDPQFRKKPLDDKTYIKNINAAMHRLNREYDEYYKLINGLYEKTSKNRENSKYPLKWMLQDKKIVQNMNKKKNKHFYNIFNYIIQKRTSLIESKELARQANIGQYIKGEKKYDYILYCPKLKYEDIRSCGRIDNLNFSASKIYLYIQECIRHGIFIDKFEGKIRKSPKTRTKIYAIGYYNTFSKNRIGRTYFLSKKRHEKSLRIFDAEYYKKSNLS
jgi:hypothetical protein